VERCAFNRPGCLTATRQHSEAANALAVSGIAVLQRGFLHASLSASPLQMPATLAAGPAGMPPVWRLDSVAVGPSGAIYVGGDKANVLYRIEPPAATSATAAENAFPTGILTNPVGWTWEFKEDGRQSFQMPEVRAWGTYAVSQNKIIFKESSSTCAPDAKEGTYAWAYDGKALSFKVLDDRCGGREGSATAGPWVKKP
jgi:hypothetical protein